MRRLTIGDKVKIVKLTKQRRYGFFSNYLNTVGTIIEDDHTEQPYKIQFDDGNWGWFHKNEVELYEANIKLEVGSTVRIKSLEWYEANKGSNGSFLCNNLTFTEEMSAYCGKEFEIKSCTFSSGQNLYKLRETDDWCFNKEMFDLKDSSTTSLNGKSLLTSNIKSSCENKITLLKRNQLITNLSIV